MYGRTVALGFGLLLASSSYAGVAVVDVSFSVQEAAPFGPGDTLTIDVLLSRVELGDPLPVRMIQFDTAVSDTDLVLDLPVTHTRGSGLVSDWIHFWYFGALQTANFCATDDASDCGQRHFLEDELLGTRLDVFSMAYLGLGENSLEELTIPGNPAESVKVGVIGIAKP